MIIGLQLQQKNLSGSFLIRHTSYIILEVQKHGDLVTEHTCLMRTIITLVNTNLVNPATYLDNTYIQFQILPRWIPGFAPPARGMERYKSQIGIS